MSLESTTLPSTLHDTVTVATPGFSPFITTDFPNKPRFADAILLSDDVTSIVQILPVVLVTVTSTIL